MNPAQSEAVPARVFLADDARRCVVLFHARAVRTLAHVASMKRHGRPIIERIEPLAPKKAELFSKKPIEGGPRHPRTEAIAANQ